MDNLVLRVQITFGAGNYEVGQIRTGTIIDGNVYRTDYSFSRKLFL